MPVQMKDATDTQRLKRDRLRQVQAEMKHRGVGALYLTDGVNVRYVLDMKIPGGEVFVPAEGEVLAFVRPRDTGYVKLKHSNIREPMYRRDAARDGSSPEEMDRFAAGITELMAQHGVAGATLGLDVLSISAILALMRAQIRLGDARPILERVSSVKTQDEVALYRMIGEQYAHTVRAFREAIRPGITENELAGVVLASWYEAGGEDIAQVNICAGENMNPWRRWPTQREVKSGEFVGIDLHGRGMHGLRGDMSRTYYAGDNPRPEERDLYRMAYDYIQETKDIFLAGRSFSEVLAAAPKVPEKYRTPLYNYNVGHGVGIGSSGYPHISKKKTKFEDTLKPNQVLAVECYFGAEGNPLAVKLEELILVTEGKPEVLGLNIPYDERFLS